MTYTCTKCGVEYDSLHQHFYLNGEHYNRHCKSCHRERNYRYAVRRKYGVTGEQFDEAWKKQDGKCIICDCDFRVNTLHVDHDHTTKAFRGLLCRDCNIGLGFFDDNVEWLKKAVEYLSS